MSAQKNVTNADQIESANSTASNFNVSSAHTNNSITNFSVSSVSSVRHGNGQDSITSRTASDTANTQGSSSYANVDPNTDHVSPDSSQNFTAQTNSFHIPNFVNDSAMLYFGPKVSAPEKSTNQRPSNTHSNTNNGSATCDNSGVDINR